MKGISLTPPWGTLVAIGAKRIETRSWSTTSRGPIAIHQTIGLNGLRRPGEPRRGVHELRNRLADLCDSDPFFTVLRPHLSGYTAAERARDLPRGAIIATARLVGVIPTAELSLDRWDVRATAATVGTDTAQEHSWECSWDLRDEQPWGDFTPGRYAWLLADAVNLYDGEECVGGRGLWDVPTDVIKRLSEVSYVGDET